MKSFCNQYIVSFAQLLEERVAIDTISNNAYAKSYLQHLLENKLYYLKIYANAIDHAIQTSHLPIEKSTLLDYGSGNGLLALFAKSIGFKHVFACDTSETFLTAAQNLSSQLAISIDEWILGDENIVSKVIVDKPLDYWIGIDVIEHVYSIPSLFNVINQMNPAMVTVFTTASVNENPIKRRKLRQLMYRDEWLDSDASQSDDEQYSGMPFLEVRKKIISQFLPSINADQLQEIAIQTRGLHKTDISAELHNFSKTQKLTYSPPDDFNTCNPISGSFTERLLPIEVYNEYYKNIGWKLAIHNGFYNDTSKTIKGVLLRLANIAIEALGKKGIVISPFIVLVSSRPHNTK